jgi:hypothetical protein
MSPQAAARPQTRREMTDELQEVQITARRLDVNPDSIVNSVATMSPDEQRNAQSRQALEGMQVTALRRSDPLAGIEEEVVVSTPRMSAQEARAYDAREALRATLGGILTQHRREQDARNMVEAEMTAGQRALVSLGGIMYNGYQSVKSGVVGVADLAASAYEWNQRVVGDLLHGDIRAAAGEYADLFGLGAEKAKAFMAGAQNLGAVLGDAESRQMLMDFAGEYYGTSSQITQSELLGKLPMELLIAAGTAGAGQVISAAGIPQRIGGAINSLADALRAVDVRSPLVPVGAGEMGMLGIKGVQNPFVKVGDKLLFVNKAGTFYPEVPDLRTGRSIAFPIGDLQPVDIGQRVEWGAKQRGEFIQEWYRGYQTPRGGWTEYDVPHIRPREFGGSNDFWNLTPIPRQTHPDFNDFWKHY